MLLKLKTIQYNLISTLIMTIIIVSCFFALCKLLSLLIWRWMVNENSLKYLCFNNIIEPPHDKTSNVVVCPAKSQISLGIRPVWSESSLSAWRKLGSLPTHCVHSEDWSDWAASAQSDQSLRCPHEESLGPYLPIVCTAKTLIRLGGCPGWSESSLGAQSFCWFCHEAAQLCKILSASAHFPWFLLWLISTGDRRVRVVRGVDFTFDRHLSKTRETVKFCLRMVKCCFWKIFRFCHATYTWLLWLWMSKLILKDQNQLLLPMLFQQFLLVNIVSY